MARRALGKPPAYVARRAFQELQSEAERFLGGRRARGFDARQLLLRTGAQSIDELWRGLADRPYVAQTRPFPQNAYEALCPGDTQRILRAAGRAVTHRVDLLGSGDIDLGSQIDWHKDYKSGFRWPPQYCRDIDYMNPGRPSDVKFPWELSRMQWVVPCGQAWLLTGDERWAENARDLIEQWIAANPYAGSVNWSCTMEAAMRILTWTWLFHACAKSVAWSDEAFRARFLCSLWLHAGFTERHIEYADVNGNHCDADAAALVFAGLFFGGTGEPARWLDRGWGILVDELPKQVSADGVDFEGSVPYHRLVTELFFLPALYRERCRLPVDAAYRERVVKMARFTAAYTRPDGIAPVWGDADDARALPFGGQDINDHRYLLGWIGASYGDDDLASRFAGDRAECAWLLGADATRALAKRPPATSPRSALFPAGGFAVLRSDADHVFIDCGPVGTAGRGGHGHNDILSFEAFLDGTHLITDCGAYVYTADYAARNAFRSTAYHNTPKIDGEEVNRFIGPDDLWWLHYDAHPEIGELRSEPSRDSFSASHAGYRRLSSPLTPRRSYTLDHAAHALTVVDEFDGAGEHDFEIALHLAIGISAEREGERFTLRSGSKKFTVTTGNSDDWRLSIEPAQVSRSYGRVTSSARLVWRRKGTAARLEVHLAPA